MPGDRAQWGRPRAFSLDALSLEVLPDLEARSIEATAELTLRRVDPEARWAHLDAIAFDLIAVERLDGDAARGAAHQYDGEVLRVDLSDVPDGGEGRVRVRYRATPRRGRRRTCRCARCADSGSKTRGDLRQTWSRAPRT